MEEQHIIRISVRNLVEFILREGDIDNRTASGNDREAMQLGSRIHRKIQKRMGSAYRAEVSLKQAFPCQDFLIQIEGRADGIIEEDGKVSVDEIKGVLKELDLIKEPEGVHLAQAKCYAYIFASQNQLKTIGVQMTYCQMETEEIKQFHYSYSLDELEAWIFDVVRKYEKWAKFQLDWRVERNESLKSLEFPFAYREGQHYLATSVYRSILRKKKLFIQAPTGVGKTMSTVFPTVKAVGEGLGEKIFYLTAKTITRTVAEQAFSILRENQMRLKTITLTAKEKICFCEKPDCNPEKCLYAKGHYDRVNDAVYDLITRVDAIDRNSLEEQARQYRVCPFEMSLDVSTWVDGVICDYNYVFDPNAHLKRFFSDGNQNAGYLFLIDEAHNLVERGREMYSATLYKEDFLDVKRLVKNQDEKLAKRLSEVNKQLLVLKRECETYQLHNSVAHISLKLLNVMGEMERYLEETLQGEERDAVLDLYFQIRKFQNIHDCLDENYVIYTELEREGRFKLKLYCVNPAANLQNYLEQGNSTVFFSATLLPIHYYKQLLSVEKEDYAIYVESTFSEKNRFLAIGRDLSTKYTRRGPQLYEKYAAYLLALVSGKSGNYMAFFPSYRFMEEVAQCFALLAEKQPEVEWIMQDARMGEEAREIFLENFEEERENTLVGFCVMGGVFAEGIDLAEDRLIGAAIVGTGLPQVCNEREILKQYFDTKHMPGFDYAYLYPGMNKVLQSAGRVIRTEEDRGIIALLDERFLRKEYQSIFPREWKQYFVGNMGQIAEQVKEFWKYRL